MKEEIENIRRRWNEFSANIDISKLPVPFTRGISNKLYDVEVYISYLQFELFKLETIQKESSELKEFKVSEEILVSFNGSDNLPARIHNYAQDGAVFVYIFGSKADTYYKIPKGDYYRERK